MPKSDARSGGLEEGLHEGEVFAGYTIVRRLGSGGMGQVYLAQHPRLPRRDALKILPLDLTANNMLVGTTAYCAPEQLQGADLDGRADQYALGCTAFDLLTGSAPFRHSNPAVVITQHLSAPPPHLSDQRPELADLDGAIAK